MNMMVMEGKEIDGERCKVKLIRREQRQLKLGQKLKAHNLMLFREKALRNFGYNISFIV